MNYFVNGEKIAIDIDKKPFGKGSEGKLFKKNNILYKIYFDNALADGFGDKPRNHIGLIGFLHDKLMCQLALYMTKVLNMLVILLIA